MKKMILSFLVVFLSQSAIAAPKDIEGYLCTFQVDNKPVSFNTPYETQGHILTSLQGVGQTTVLGLPFAVKGQNFPNAHIYTYSLSSGQQRLLMQVLSATGELLKTQIFNAEIPEGSIVGEIPSKLNNGSSMPSLFFDLRCSRM
jgi:hypothetical protein